MAAAIVGAGVVLAIAAPPPVAVGTPQKVSRTRAGETRRTVFVYGDSLLEGSVDYVTERIAAERPGWGVVVHARAGTAICDWFTQMRADASLEPDLVVLQFSGNALTPCMVGTRVGGTPAKLTKYRDDAEWAGRFWTSRGASVLFVGSPRGYTEPELSVPHYLDSVYRAIAQRWAGRGVTFSDRSERALSVPDPSDPGRAVFAPEMPCLASERGMPQCVDGRIRVRGPDGLHFCPAEGVVYPCPVYSSGSLRFGTAIADAAITTMS